MPEREKLIREMELWINSRLFEQGAISEAVFRRALALIMKEGGRCDGSVYCP